MLRQLALVVAATVTVGFLPSLLPAQGGSGRAFRTQPIRAGILINPSAPNNASAAPFAWYNLENAASVKPAEWTLVNPNNEGTVSQTTFNRWSGIDGTIATTAYQTRVTNGLRTQKRYASYWEVDISSATDSDLAQYDVLLYAPLGPVQLNPSERGKLNRFIDGGGVLWADIDQRAVPSVPGLNADLDPANGLPIPFAVQKFGLPFSGVQNDSFHPIFNSPLPIGGADQNRLAFQYGGEVPASAIVPVDVGGLSALLSTIPLGGDYSRLRPVSQFQKGGTYYPTAMVGRLGDGYQVVTIRQVAQKLNRTAADGSLDVNRLFVAREPRLLPEGIAAAKFAVNVVGLTSSAAQFGGGSRKGFASGTDIGGPLLNRYSANRGNTVPVDSDVKNLRPPVVSKGLVFISEGRQVAVYDADPGRDADGDGDPDDGILDYSLGEARDLIFRTEAFGTTISSPSVAEIIDVVGTAPRDQILVTDDAGRLAIFPVYGNIAAGRRTWPVGLPAVALPVTAESVITPPAPVTGPPVGATGATIFPPTVYGSFAYLVDTEAPGGLGATPTSRLRIIDLRNGQALVSLDGGERFIAGGRNAATPPPSGPATVGQIPIADNSGGSDVVAYVPLRGVTGGGNNTGPGFASFWIGVKGEKPVSTRFEGSPGSYQVILDTRASQQGGLPLVNTNGAGSPIGIRVTVIKNDGSPYNAAEMAAIGMGTPYNTQDGSITIPINVGAWPAGVDADNPVRVDYTIDWGLAEDQGKTTNIERGRLLFPFANVPATEQQRLIGGLALGPQGTLFATVGSQNLTAGGGGRAPLGTVYAVKEEGRGSFRMAWRWDLYPQHTITFEGGAGTQTYPSSLPDYDPVQYLQFGGFDVRRAIGGRFINASIQGAPVVRGDKVFVTVTGSKLGEPGRGGEPAIPFPSPSSAILAFAAEPPQAEIRTSLDLSDGFAIVQPDFARSTDQGTPRTNSILVSNNGNGESVTFDKAASGVGGTIRFTSLAGSRNGQILDSISLSQPVLLRRAGQGDQLIEPSAQGRWSPLLWYTILHGTQLYGPAFGAGNTLYVSGSSLLPTFVLQDSGAGLLPNFDGVINAIRTDVDTQNAPLAGNASVSVNTATFAPNSVVLDPARPWLRQLISLDYVRTTATYDAPQRIDAPIVGSPYFVMPQNPRYTPDRYIADGARFTGDDYRTRVRQSIIPNSERALFGAGSGPASYGVVGGDRTLVTWDERGHSGFSRTDFWVADEGRIARIDPSGNVLFDSRASLRQGEGGASGAANVIPLVRPTRVVPVANDDDLLVVDTGANKILRMEPGGTVQREIGGFSLDPNFVPNGFRAGESLTLKNPRDAATFTTRVLAANNPFTTPAPVEEWVHTLIADEGNNRLVEVIDRIALDAGTSERVDFVGNRGTLLWHSPANVSGKGYDYVSVSRVRIPDLRANTDRFAYVAGLGTFSPGRQDAGEAPPNNGTGTGAVTPPDDRDAIGGGIVVFDPQLPAGVVVYSSIDLPAATGLTVAVPGAKRWNDRRDTDTGDTFADRDGVNDGDDGWGDLGPNTLPDIPVQTTATGNAKRLTGVSSVTASVVIETIGGVTQPVIAVMVADRTGVYEVVPVPAPLLADPVTGVVADPNRTVLTMRWMITNEAYRAMRRTGADNATPIVSSDSPAGFLPTYARRLDRENVLIVNGFVGKTRGRYNANGTVAFDGVIPLRPEPFRGEVVQLDGRIAPVPVTARGNISNGFNVQNDNLGFGARSVKVRFGVLEGARGILQPVFADRR